MRKLFFSISLLLITISTAFAQNCQKEITTFVSNPNQVNYFEIYRIDKAKSVGICWLEIKKNTNTLSKLYEHIRKGNQWSVNIIVNHLSDLDGGELEDAFIAIGESVESDPKILLQLYKNKLIAKHHLEQALVALPLTLVDDKRGTLLALKQRIIKISSIKNSHLNYQKAMAINVLDNQIKHIIKGWP